MRNNIAALTSMFALALLAVSCGDETVEEVPTLVLSPTETPTQTLLADTPDADRAALVALFNATDGEGWKNNTNWLSNTTLEHWYGITTDDSGRVVRLALDNNDLAKTGLRRVTD